jgi:DNA helicase-2/ATP-dependent DNA helicase PcrA
MSTLFDFMSPESRPERGDDGLNAQQRAAVRHGEGPLVVVAGAGTGKTRVITERVVHLLETQPDLTGQQILALTYTDKAAGEMRSRITRAAGERAKGLTVSTFHSFCNSLLQETNPTLRLIDEVDHWILLRRNLAKLQLERYRRLAEPGQFLGDFVKFFSRCQDELVTPADYQRYADGLTAAVVQAPVAATEEEKEALAMRREEAARQREIARAYQVSDDLLRERNLLTFGAAILDTVRQLQTNAAFLECQRARFRFILVDEFQDTNFAQIVLLELLAGPGRNLFVVGDDDQAIYRFRGASFANFTLFRDRFVLAGNSGAKAQRAEVVLNENYRSSKRILRVAEASIRQNGPQNRYRPDKNLVTANPEGEKVVLAEFSHPRQEAQWIAEEIGELHRRGHEWRKFAVLYRAHNHREHLIEALRHRGIPFVIRKLSILSSPLIRDLLAYLRLIDSAHDNVACARVLAMPAWGLTAEDLVRSAKKAREGKGISLWDVVCAQQEKQAPAIRMTGDPAGGAALVKLVADLRSKARQLSALEVFDQLVAEIGLVPFPSAGDGKHLHQFARFVREWEAKSETHSLREFCEYFRYFEEAGGQINRDEEEGHDAVELMTVHAAKGLEFSHTFVMRLSRGAFPTYARQPVLEFPLELMKEEHPSGDFHVQEERRLFYVALTRAQKRLTLTTVVNKRSKPSIFLDDILGEPGIARADLVQCAPTVEVPPPAIVVEDSTVAAPLFPAETTAGRIGSQIARWAMSYRPPVFEPLELSASAVDSYDTCPQKFLFESRWGLRGRPHAAVTFGSVMHLTIREFVKGLKQNARFPFDQVESIYLREWRSAGFEDDYQEGLYKSEGLEQLRAFHATTIEAPPGVLHQEKSFELLMPGNIVVTGRMDQVNRFDSGGVEIVDYKTGRPRSPTHAKKSLQLSLYAIAAREALELVPERLVFYNLSTNEAVASTRSGKQLDEARERVAEVAAEIRAGNFPATPGFYCRSCEFRPVCPAHEQLVPVPDAAPQR